MAKLGDNRLSWICWCLLFVLYLDSCKCDRTYCTQFLPKCVTKIGPIPWDENFTMKMDKIVYLSVSNNEIVGHPVEFPDLENLNELIIVNTTLDHLDKLKYKWLQKAHFISDGINSIAEDAFEVPTNLSSIDLSQNLLTSLPSKLFTRLPYLNHINLSNNKIANISRDIFSANSFLMTIKFQSNSLEELSMDIFSNITKLEVLDISNNYLHKFIPSEMFLNMQDGVSILDLSNNLLTILDLRNIRVANVILNSNYLRKLSLGLGCVELFAKNNEIEDISLDASAATLQMLQLNHNKLGDNIGSICQCENLRSIFLSHNNITKIGFCFGKMRTLKELNLSGNKLSQIDYGYFFTDFLETLDLSYNIFEEFDENILPLFQNLRYLYLDGNRLSEFPKDLDTIMPHLVLIGLSHNRFECKKLLTLYRQYKATNRIAFNIDEPSPVNMTNIRGMICYKKNESEIPLDDTENATSDSQNHLKISNSIFRKELQKLRLKLENSENATLNPEYRTELPLISPPVTNITTPIIMEAETAILTEKNLPEETDQYPSTTNINEYHPQRAAELRNDTNATVLDDIFKSLMNIEGKIKDLGQFFSQNNRTTVTQSLDDKNSEHTLATISAILAVAVIVLVVGVLWYNYHSYFFYKKLRENNAEALRTFPNIYNYQ
ncbi:leucine-rich repeat-containing protein 15-like [Phlebotomus papatasi]|uniref:leucine-rich repeat-containing protein 15-like n=1 Tax=Phlebotomus papatasi TaxID=29031 RepID=UPI00248398E3|nr:leucine-rich repeat-containing protein 15-like [Phlebotomus papatasi]